MRKIIYKKEVVSLLTKTSQLTHYYMKISSKIVVF